MITTLSTCVVILFCCFSSLLQAAAPVPVGANVQAQDYNAIPELREIDSLLAVYAYGEADDLLARLIADASGESRKNREKRLLLWQRLGYSYLENGYFDSSTAIYRRADSLTGKLYGARSAEKAYSVYCLGKATRLAGDFNTTDSLLAQSVNIYEHIGGETDPRLLMPYFEFMYINFFFDNLELIHLLLDRAQAMIASEAEPDPLEQHLFAQYSGLYYSFTGDFERADSSFKSTIGLCEKYLGARHLIDCYYELAQNDDSRQNSAQAIVYAQKALELAERTYRPGHPLIGSCLALEGKTYTDNDQYEKALPCYLRAEDILINSVGRRHYSYGALLSYLANYYSLIRNFEKAIEYSQAHIDYNVDVYGPQSNSAMFSKRNLGVIYVNQYDYEKAIPLLDEYATFLHARHDPEDDIELAQLYNVLAFANFQSGDYHKADSLYQLDYPMISKFYGANNEYCGEIETYMGMNYYAMGDFQRAETSFFSALANYESNLVPHNPRLTGLCIQMAVLYGSMGQFDESLKYFERVLANRYKFMSGAYSYTSADQKIRFLDTHHLLMHSAFSLAMKSHQPDIIEFTFDMLARGKAMGIEVLTSEYQVAKCSEDDETARVYDSLQILSSDIAELTYSIADVESRQTRTPVLDSLFDVQEALEERLSHLCHSAAGAVMSRSITSRDIARHLPGRSVLLDYAVYDPFEFDGLGSGHSRFGDAHYLVYALDTDGIMELHDLGPASLIDSLVASVREQLDNVSPDVFSSEGKVYEDQLRRTTAQLYALLIEPIDHMLTGHNRLVVSPDGLLSLLAFEILPTGDNLYLAETHEISYVSTSRDLLKYSPKRASAPRSMAIFYDPDFDNVAPRPADAISLQVSPGGIDHDILVWRGSDCISHEFPRLEYTRHEAREIENILNDLLSKGIAEYGGGLAREEAAKQLPEVPDILHFATHGFICPAENNGSDTYQDLLLYSGLALAGANAIFDTTINTSATGEDGILTALEISGLDLRGTQLVTLSACETGIGKSLIGEGVFGLRRAIQQTGAESILMSLWKVPDRQCADMMTDFYTNWVGHGESKATALRQASLQMLNAARKKYGSGHPVLWSGFILAGNPY